MRPFFSGLTQLYRASGRTAEAEPVPPMPRYGEFRQFLLSLDMPDADASRYLEVHLDRIAISLSLVPAPARTGRVLELGAYLHMTPALSCVLKYREVLGAYFGPSGERINKSASVNGQRIFECCFDLFDAELDPYPYADRSFDCVLACEIFEHFLHDPMHMLAETWRILDDNGTLLLTTPNVASATAVARALDQSANPQLYSKFADPRRPSSLSEVGHMREYTPNELRQVLASSGFDIVHLFSRSAPGYRSQERVNPLIHLLGYSTKLRGEQLFCLARKSARGIAERYPDFLYEV